MLQMLTHEVAEHEETVKVISTSCRSAVCVPKCILAELAELIVQYKLVKCCLSVCHCVCMCVWMLTRVAQIVTVHRDS